ncbi:hypothetical protein BQ8794_220050 [Mesorhizobium prunaredense]|uniref:Uncharacterized protein n=1 Tax=Mesorhizobium prunaredense TaxID=1631249 RepID=A0A1R3VAV7_9HYPH|nr:hypothetical protein BQ8794_220050 [Mesorhizobium prunaredense]
MAAISKLVRLAGDGPFINGTRVLADMGRAYRLRYAEENDHAQGSRVLLGGLYHVGYRYLRSLQRTGAAT